MTSNDEFLALLADCQSQEAFVPRMYQNPHNDSLEILITDEDFVAERMDEFVTVLRGRGSGHIVGSIIKGVSTRVIPLIKEHPGLRVEITDHKFRLEHFFAYGQVRATDDFHALNYKTLREQAEANELELELCV